MSELQSPVVGGQLGGLPVSAAHTMLQRGPNILVNRDWTQETGAQQNSPNILPGNTRFNNTISLHKTASSSNLVIHTTYTLRNIYTSKAPKCVSYTLMPVWAVHRRRMLLMGIYSEHKHTHHQSTP